MKNNKYDTIKTICGYIYRYPTSTPGKTRVEWVSFFKAYKEKLATYDLDDELNVLDLKRFIWHIVTHNDSYL